MNHLTFEDQISSRITAGTPRSNRYRRHEIHIHTRAGDPEVSPLIHGDRQRWKTSGSPARRPANGAFHRNVKDLKTDRRGVSPLRSYICQTTFCFESRADLASEEGLQPQTCPVLGHL
ncbi:unnamed protein product [Pleuronectes platessa]|uniref:Uncharacterized protein n=1 Tax=Pleuronectes platessa TaxID=8262 RepID=A0A9N7V764_PLEPL|nr:unnamed protein product [Pleuronectes platessa]